MASALDIEFPGNLAQVASASLLRAVPTSGLLENDLYLVSGLGLYGFDAGSVAVDDGVSVIRPFDRTTLQAGRWLLTGSSVFATGASLAALSAGLAAPGGSGLVGFLQAGTDAQPRPLQDKLRANIDLDDYRKPADADDSPAFARAIAFMKLQGGGVCHLAQRDHILSSAIELDTGDNNISLIFCGKGTSTKIIQTGAGQPVIRIGQIQRLRNSGLKDMRLRSAAGAGPVVQVGAQGFEWFAMHFVDMEQLNPGGRLWYAPNGNMFYLRQLGGYMFAHPASTVAPVYIRAQTTTVNHNVWDTVCYNSFTEPFFDIANEALDTWLIGNTITAIFQNCNGGGIRFANAKAWKLDFNFWDLNPDNGYDGHLVHAASNGGYESIDCDIRIERNGNGMAGAARDVMLTAGQDFTIKPMTSSADNPIYDWNNKRVTVTGRPYTELNFNNRVLLLGDSSRFIQTLAQNAYGDTLHIGGLMDPERATLKGSAGFVELKTTVAGTGILLNALSGSSTEHKLVFQADGAAFYPLTDNFTSLGLNSNRFTVVYASTGTINTSDARLKQWRGGLNDSELAAAKEIAATIGVFQFKDAVKYKGDDARLHVGVKAQQVIEIMASHGLDPFAYGFICYDAWEAAEAVVDGEREVIPARAAGDVYGIRYEELAMFLAAAQEVRLAALEAK